MQKADLSARGRRRPMSSTALAPGEAAIWARVLESEQAGLSREAARSLLALTFDDRDRARMNELAAKNRDGTISAAERKDLESYVKVGDVLSLFHLKARRSLTE